MINVEGVILDMVDDYIMRASWGVEVTCFSFAKKSASEMTAKRITP